MFLNTIGLICVSLCSLLSNNYREVNVVDKIDKPHQDFYNAEQYVYLGSSEFGTFEYYRHLIGNLSNYQYFYNTTYTIDDFMNGTTIFFRPPNNTSFVFGTLTAGNFVTWDYVTGISMHLDRSDDYKDNISYKFYWDSDARWVEVKAYFIYSDTSKTYCVANLVTYNRNDLVDPASYVYRYDTSSTLKSVFPSDFTTFTYDQGYDVGNQDGYNTGYNIGYRGGYVDGYDAASSIDTTASTIFTGILDVALIPVNVFLSIFNFEVFGINIGGIVSALLTVSVVIIIFRFLFGGKKDD